MGIQTLEAERLLREREAARYLNYAMKTLQSWRNQGVGPKYLKVGSRTVRYRLDDLKAWVYGK